MTVDLEASAKEQALLLHRIHTLEEDYVSVMDESRLCKEELEKSKKKIVALEAELQGPKSNPLFTPAFEAVPMSNTNIQQTIKAESDHTIVDSYKSSRHQEATVSFLQSENNRLSKSLEVVSSESVKLKDRITLLELEALNRQNLVHENQQKLYEATQKQTVLELELRKERRECSVLLAKLEGGLQIERVESAWKLSASCLAEEKERQYVSLQAELRSFQEQLEMAKSESSSLHEINKSLEHEVELARRQASEACLIQMKDVDEAKKKCEHFEKLLLAEKQQTLVWRVKIDSLLSELHILSQWARSELADFSVQLDGVNAELLVIENKMQSVCSGYSCLNKDLDSAKEAIILSSVLQTENMSLRSCVQEMKNEQKMLQKQLEDSARRFTSKNQEHNRILEHCKTQEQALLRTQNELNTLQEKCAQELVEKSYLKEKVSTLERTTLEMNRKTAAVTKEVGFFTQQVEELEKDLREERQKSEKLRQSNSSLKSEYELRISQMIKSEASGMQAIINSLEKELAAARQRYVDFASGRRQELDSANRKIAQLEDELGRDRQALAKELENKLTLMKQITDLQQKDKDHKIALRRIQELETERANMIILLDEKREKIACLSTEYELVVSKRVSHETNCLQGAINTLEKELADSRERATEVMTRRCMDLDHIQHRVLELENELRSERLACAAEVQAKAKLIEQLSALEKSRNSEQQDYIEELKMKSILLDDCLRKIHELGAKKDREDSLDHPVNSDSQGILRQVDERDQTDLVKSLKDELAITRSELSDLVSERCKDLENANARIMKLEIELRSERLAYAAEAQAKSRLMESHAKLEAELNSEKLARSNVFNEKSKEISDATQKLSRLEKEIEQQKLDYRQTAVVYRERVQLLIEDLKLARRDSNYIRDVVLNLDRDFRMARQQLDALLIERCRDLEEAQFRIEKLEEGLRSESLLCSSLTKAKAQLMDQVASLEADLAAEKQVNAALKRKVEDHERCNISSQKLIAEKEHQLKNAGTCSEGKETTDSREESFGQSDYRTRDSLVAEVNRLQQVIIHLEKELCSARHRVSDVLAERFNDLDKAKQRAADLEQELTTERLSFAVEVQSKIRLAQQLTEIDSILRSELQQSDAVDSVIDACRKLVLALRMSKQNVEIEANRKGPVSILVAQSPAPDRCQDPKNALSGDSKSEIQRLQKVVSSLEKDLDFARTQLSDVLTERCSELEFAQQRISQLENDLRSERLATAAEVQEKCQLLGQITELNARFKPESIYNAKMDCVKSKGFVQNSEPASKVAAEVIDAEVQSENNMNAGSSDAVVNQVFGLKEIINSLEKEVSNSRQTASNELSEGCELLDAENKKLREQNKFYEEEVSLIRQQLHEESARYSRDLEIEKFKVAEISAEAMRRAESLEAEMLSRRVIEGRLAAFLMDLVWLNQRFNDLKFQISSEGEISVRALLANKAKQDALKSRNILLEQQVESLSTQLKSIISKHNDVELCFREGEEGWCRKLREMENQMAAQTKEFESAKLELVAARRKNSEGSTLLLKVSSDLERAQNEASRSKKCCCEFAEFVHSEAGILSNNLRAAVEGILLDMQKQDQQKQSEFNLRFQFAEESQNRFAEMESTLTIQRSEIQYLKSVVAQNEEASQKYRKMESELVTYRAYLAAALEKADALIKQVEPINYLLAQTEQEVHAQKKEMEGIRLKLQGLELLVLSQKSESASLISSLENRLMIESSELASLRSAVSLNSEAVAQRQLFETRLLEMQNNSELLDTENKKLREQNKFYEEEVSLIRQQLHEESARYSRDLEIEKFKVAEISAEAMRRAESLEAEMLSRRVIEGRLAAFLMDLVWLNQRFNDLKFQISSEGEISVRALLANKAKQDALKSRNILLEQQVESLSTQLKSIISKHNDVELCFREGEEGWCRKLREMENQMAAQTKEFESAKLELVAARRKNSEGSTLLLKVSSDLERAQNEASRSKKCCCEFAEFVHSEAGILSNNLRAAVEGILLDMQKKDQFIIQHRSLLSKNESDLMKQRSQYSDLTDTIQMQKEMVESLVYRTINLCNILFECKQRLPCSKLLILWNAQAHISRTKCQFISHLCRKHNKSNICFVFISWRHATLRNRTLADAKQNEVSYLRELDGTRQEANALTEKATRLRVELHQEREKRSHVEQQLEESLEAGECLQIKLSKLSASASAAEEKVAKLEKTVSTTASAYSDLERKFLDMSKAKADVECELMVLRSKVLGISTAI